MDGTIFGKRAGQALDALFPEQNRDKAIARLFGVSTRMARYLRAGDRWTLERLAFASNALGQKFNEMLIPRDQPIVPKETIEDKLDRIDRQLAKLSAENKAIWDLLNGKS